MRRLLSLGIILTLLVLLLLPLQIWQVKAPELFGGGALYLYTDSNRVLGFINGWGSYFVYGKVSDCRIVPINSPVGDAKTVNCRIVFNEKNTVFRGWIDFRGHPRPFCGALDIASLPVKCFGE